MEKDSCVKPSTTRWDWEQASHSARLVPQDTPSCAWPGPSCLLIWMGSAYTHRGPGLCLCTHGQLLAGYTGKFCLKLFLLIHTHFYEISYHKLYKDRLLPSCEHVSCVCWEQYLIWKFSRTHHRLFWFPCEQLECALSKQTCIYQYYQ